MQTETQTEAKMRVPHVEVTETRAETRAVAAVRNRRKAMPQKIGSMTSLKLMACLDTVEAAVVEAAVVEVTMVVHVSSQ